MKPPVYLDRDGVINQNRSDYVREPRHWVPIPGAVEAVARLRREGHPVIVVTNQSGVARGYYTESAVQDIHRVMTASFRAAGADVDGVYFCPHGPSGGCGCRKPETGMIDRARREHSLSAEGWIVGDADSDMELGRRSGLETILVLTGRGYPQLDLIRKQGRPEPDHVTESLASAVDIILATPLRRG